MHRDQLVLVSALIRSQSACAEIKEETDDDGADNTHSDSGGTEANDTTSEGGTTASTTEGNTTGGTTTGGTTTGGANPPSDINCYHYVYVTSYSGNQEGDFNYAAAKNLCQAEGDSSPLLAQNQNWVPILSTSINSANELIEINGPVCVVDATSGTIAVAAGQIDFWDGTLSAPIDRNSFGHTVSGHVWTGSTYNGGMSPDNCGNWSENNRHEDGIIGLVGATNNQWLNLESRECDDAYRYYCISQIKTSSGDGDDSDDGITLNIGGKD